MTNTCPLHLLTQSTTHNKHAYKPYPSYITNQHFSQLGRSKHPQNILLIFFSNIELGVNSASFQFNDGAHGISNVLDQFSMKYRIYTNIGSSKIDESSIQWSSTKSSKAREKKRKQLRGIKKGVIDKNNEQEKVRIFLVDFNVIYAICINYICYM